MSHKSFFSFILLFFITSLCAGLRFRNCKSPEGEVVSLKHDPECGEKLCTLNTGTNSTTYIEFKPNKDVQKLRIRLMGIFMNNKYPYPVDEPNACVGQDYECPLEKDSTYTFQSTFYVKKSYPPVKAGVQWELVDDETKKSVVCLTYDIKIRSSSNTEQ